VSETELSSGYPFVVDHQRGQVAGIDATGQLVLIAGGAPQVLARSATEAAFAFDPEGQLLALHPDGSVTTIEGRVVATFDLGGTLDVTSGASVSGTSIAFAVERHTGGFVVLIGDLQTGATRAVAEDPEFVGFPRWSPDGSQLLFTDYTSLYVHRLATEFTATIEPADVSELSGRVTSPAWVDPSRIVFVDAAPALVLADVASGQMLDVHEFDPGESLVPALPTLLPIP
jgi:hypothetical protein